MRRYVFFLIFISHFAISQNNYLGVVEPRLSFLSDKSEATDVKNYVIANNDTLYAKYKINYDLSYLNDSLYSKKFMYRYKTMVFRHTNENSKIINKVQQWSVPIVIYLDNQLPKTVRKQFEEFYAQVKDIDNIDIAFASKLEDANYYIKVTSKTINAYEDDYKFYDDAERENSVLTGATYKLQTDYNNKYYSGILSINPSLKDDEMLLKQLKQMFYLSLGNFYMFSTSTAQSLLSEDYDNAETIINDDLNNLKIHYSIIYENDVNGTTFDKLLQLSNIKQ